jgi:four helix bundle protein
LKKITNFEDLIVWKRAHKFVLDCYNLASSFPKEEKHRIVDQLLRAAISVPTNIAEAMGRYGTKDVIKFLIIARGSVSETKYLILLAKDLKYIDEEKWQEIQNELNGIGKMINGLINSIKSKLLVTKN